MKRKRGLSAVERAAMRYVAVHNGIDDNELNDGPMREYEKLLAQSAPSWIALREACDRLARARKGKR